MQRITLFLLLALAVSACHTTKVYQRGTPGMPGGYEITKRQWFTIGGLVGLSDPAGQECPNGVVATESQLSALDVLVNVGVFVGGVVVGNQLCSDEPEYSRASCAVSSGWLAQFFISPRTVRYRCAAGPGGHLPYGPQQPIPPAYVPPTTPAYVPPAHQQPVYSPPRPVPVQPQPH